MKSNDHAAYLPTYRMRPWLSFSVRPGPMVHHLRYVCSYVCTVCMYLVKDGDVALVTPIMYDSFGRITGSSRISSVSRGE